MNLGACRVVLRPRSVAEVLDLATRLSFNEAMLPNLRLAAATLLPMYAALMVMRYVLEIEWGWVYVATLALSVLAEGPFTILASRLLFREESTVWMILRPFAKRFFSYAMAVTWSAAAVGLSALLLVGPLFVGPMGLLVAEANLLEGAGPLDSFTRSRALVSQRAGEGLQATLAIWGARIVFCLGFELLAQSVISDLLQLGRPLGGLADDGGSPYSVLGLLAAVPFVATSHFMLYIDTRTRADGWDLQVKLLSVVEAGRRVNP